MQNPQNDRLGSTLRGKYRSRERSAVEPAAALTSLVTTDPAEFEIALRPWELLCRPRCGGEFRHILQGLQTTEFIIYRERFTVPVDVVGISPENTVVLGAPMSIGRGAYYWHTPYCENIMPSSLPGPLDVSLAAGHTHQVALVDIPFLEASLPEDVLDRLLSAIRSRFISVPQDVMGKYLAWGNRLFNMAQRDPSLFENGAIVTTVREELLQHLSCIAGELISKRDRTSCSARHRGLLRVLEAMRRDVTASHSMAELCKVAGISERSLQYGFRETFDMTPLQFVKRRRLHAARQALLTASKDKTTVAEVATGYGFCELGRFGADYRKVFGELPSVTLGRAGDSPSN